MVNYIEYIKAAGVETYQLRDPEAARKQETEESLGNKVSRNDIFDLVYPVGSIYLGVNNTNPSTLFGGTWEQIKDKFLLSAGDTYVGGATGGEAEHTLTTDELPSHKHGFLDYWATSWDSVTNGRYAVAVNGDGKGIEADKVNSRTYTAAAGGGKAHNNMPPYLAVYVWKRTA